MERNLKSIPEQNEREDSHSDSESLSLSDSDSYGSIDAEWASHIDEEGSLVYIESYVSSTVKEKQAHQALKAASELEKKTFSSPNKSIRHHTKLLNLLRRRPSVRMKKSRSSNSDGSRSLAGVGTPVKGVSEQSPLKVTFRDNPSGEVRKVILRVSEEGNNLGRRASVCETVLGVMPGRFSEPPDSRVMVAGLAPGSQALKDSTIKIGDWLKEVNGKEITWQNLDRILLNIEVPSDVILCVQKCASETLPGDDLHSSKRVTQTQLVKLIIGKDPSWPRWEGRPSDAELPLHTVLYLSLAGLTDSSPDRADIKFQFPPSNNKLVQVRGMFITIAHSLQEVTSESTLSSSVMLDGEYYHVAYSKELKDVFLIALPHSCISASDVVILMDQLCNLIKFEFGSLADGLADPSHKKYISHLLSLILEEVFLFDTDYHLGKLKINEGPLLSSSPSCFSFSSITHHASLAFSWLRNGLLFPYPRTLLLKDEVAKLQIENCLNELESGDFGDDESDCEDCQLLYNIIGSCIFYKGYLLSSHLSSEALQDVWLFAHHHRLLMLVGCEAVSQLVVWKAVYPREEEGLPLWENQEVLHYLLVVAMNHFLLAVLVESGNVTELLDEKAGPDPFLVDQAETTLYHLHSLHVHAACEESLCSGGLDTITLDDKISSLSPQKKSKHAQREDAPDSLLKVPDVPSILKQKSSTMSELHVRDSPISGELDQSVGEGSDDSPSSSGPPKETSFDLEDKQDDFDDEDADEFDAKDENSSDSDWRILKNAERSGIPYPTDIDHSKQKCDTFPPLRLTVGKTNVLFHVLQLEMGEGVVISAHTSPLSLSSAPPTKRLHSQLLQTFYETCSHIRHVLLSGYRQKMSGGNYCGGNSLNNVREYGVMFTCNDPGGSKKKNHQVSYWVVGRHYGSPYQREIYVCFDDTIPQNIQEIAFKLTLGCG